MMVDHKWVGYPIKKLWEGGKFPNPCSRGSVVQFLVRIRRVFEWFSASISEPSNCRLCLQQRGAGTPLLVEIIKLSGQQRVLVQIAEASKCEQAEPEVVKIGWLILIWYDYFNWYFFNILFMTDFFQLFSELLISVTIGHLVFLM